MLTVEQFADEKRLAKWEGVNDTLEFLVGCERHNAKAATQALHSLAMQLAEAQRKLEIDQRAMEMVAHFIKDHELFAAASASIIQAAKVVPTEVIK